MVQALVEKSFATTTTEDVVSVSDSMSGTGSEEKWDDVRVTVVPHRHVGHHKFVGRLSICCSTGLRGGPSSRLSHPAFQILLFPKHKVTCCYKKVAPF